MILPGTKIVCPDCRLHIATTNMLLEQDEEDGAIYWDDLDFVIPAYFKHTQAKGTKCPRCQTSWSDSSGRISTDHDWEQL